MAAFFERGFYMASQYIITGASSDVGVLLIGRLLEREPDAQVVAQGYGDLGGLAPLLQQHADRLAVLDVNLSDPAATDAFVRKAAELCPCPTHLVHLPALRVVNTKFKNFDLGRYWADMQVQVGSAAALCKTFLPVMARQKTGRVLFMLTSYVIGVPPKNTAAYVMAKEAVHGLAKSLAADYAASGITVNCVAPSMMETKFLADTPDLIVQAAAEAHPMGRNATPADVVPAMEFLLGPDSGFITGVVLPITGGSSF